MKVSIVLSTYNGERFIVEQLESLRNQTCPADEVIICDDCSTDSTYSIIENYITKNKLHNWILKRNENNKGWRRNFVELVSVAEGDLIYLCDQDDVWEKEKLSVMNEIMLNNPEINILVSYLTEFYDNGNRRIYPNKPDGIVTKIKLTRRFMNVLFPGCTYCLRAEFAKLCNKYWTVKSPHDGLYWRLGMFDESLFVVHLPLINQRKHRDSTFSIEARSSKTVKMKMEEIEYTYDVLEAIKNMLIDEKKNNEINGKIIGSAYRWNKLRDKMYKDGNLFLILKLIPFIPYYQTNKRFLLDAYIVSKNKFFKMHE